MVLFNKKKKAQALVEQSMAKKNQQHFKSSLLALYEAVELDAGNIEAHKLIGEFCFKEKSLTRSLEAFNEVLRLDSEEKEAYNYKGKILRRKGMKKEAAQVFVEALKKFPDYKAPAYNLASLQLGEDLEESEVQTRISMVKPPGKMILANIGRKMGEPAFQAEKEAADAEIKRLEEKAIEHPNWPDTWFNLATARVIFGDHKKALEGFIKALKIYPKYENALLNLGVAYYYLDERDKAKALWMKLAKMNSKNKAAYLNLHQLFVKKKAFVPATAMLLKAYEAVDDQRDQVMKDAIKAYSCYQDGELEKAESLFLRVHDAKPNYPDILLYLGNCSLKKQELLRALNYWLKAIQINAGYESALNNMKTVKDFMLSNSEKLFRAKEYQKVLENLEPLIRIFPDDQDIAVLLYRVYSARRDSRGIQDMEKILAG